MQWKFLWMALACFIAPASAHADEPTISASNEPPIRSGGLTEKDRQFWSFQKLHRPDTPNTRTSKQVRTPIDAFILARLEAKGLMLAEEADRTTLVRRLYLDLIGLPPSPEEVRAFLDDSRPDAYEHLLDRLLASPHFGERWGRHWLDSAGYVDVTGGDNDAGTIKLGEGKWRYRDYVVQSFNQDKPFDQFLIEQLAGDELVDWRSLETWSPQVKEFLTATGFLRTASDDTDENELNTLDIRHSVWQRTGEMLASNLLGLTLNCAKCHDHKYEPITQRDYYSFQAILGPAFNPENWLQPKARELVALPLTEKAEIDRRRAELEQHIKEVNDHIGSRVLEQKLLTIPEVIRTDVRQAVLTTVENRNAVQKYLADKFWPSLKPTDEEMKKETQNEERKKLEGFNGEIRALNERLEAAGRLQMVYDVGPPSPTRMLVRGDHDRPAEEVPPAVLGVLHESDSAALLDRAKTLGQSSGRRFALAKRLTDWKSRTGALVLRVRVNRVWQQLFGRGIVESSDNFGLTGTPPTHPELLEWLAAEFANPTCSPDSQGKLNGGSLKPFLKLIMRSHVYRQISTSDENHPGFQVDPDNHMLWRMPIRRLEAEIVRDSLLAVSGKLDRSLGGPPIPVKDMPDGSFKIKTDGLPTPTSHWRRSLYLLTRRNYHPTLLGVFDLPVMTSNCTCRNPSAVVLQSLTMLNDEAVTDLAGAFAELVSKQVGGSENLSNEAVFEKRVEAAFLLAFARQPKQQEKELCVDLLKGQTAQYHHEMGGAIEEAALKALTNLCHMLVNTNEFIYVG